MSSRAIRAMREMLCQSTESRTVDAEECSARCWLYRRIGACRVVRRERYRTRKADPSREGLAKHMAGGRRPVAARRGSDGWHHVSDGCMRMSCRSRVSQSGQLRVCQALMGAVDSCGQHSRQKRRFAAFGIPKQEYRHFWSVHE